MPEQHIDLLNNDAIAAGTTQDGGGTDPPSARELNIKEVEQTFYLAVSIIPHLTAHGLGTVNDITDNFLMVYDKPIPNDSIFGLTWTPDGSSLILANATQDTLVEFQTEQPFSYVGLTQIASQSVSGVNTIENIAWNKDGSKLFIGDDGPGKEDVVEYSVSTPFDITTISETTRLDISSEVFPNGITFNNAGSKLYVIGQNTTSGGRRVVSYNLSTPFDLTTASFNQGFSLPSDPGIPTGLTWDKYGENLFYTGLTTEESFSHLSAGTAFDVSTLALQDQVELVEVIGPDQTLNDVTIQEPPVYVTNFFDDWEDGNFTSDPPWNEAIVEGDGFGNVRTSPGGVPTPNGGDNTLHVHESTGGGTEYTLDWGNDYINWDGEWTWESLWYTTEFYPADDAQDWGMMPFWNGTQGGATGGSTDLGITLGHRDALGNIVPFEIRGNLITTINQNDDMGGWFNNTWYWLEVNHDGSGNYEGFAWPDGVPKPNSPNAVSTGSAPSADARPGAVTINGGSSEPSYDMDVAFVRWTTG